MKKGRFIYLSLVLLFVLTLTSSTYAALVAFVYDTNRIIVESKFYYEFDAQNSSNNITVTSVISDDDVVEEVFSFPAGGNTNARTFTIIFKVAGIQGKTFHFAAYGVYTKVSNNGITSIVGSGGGVSGNNARGIGGSNEVSKTLTVTVRSRNIETATLGIVFLTPTEFNSNPSTVTGQDNKVFRMVN